LSGPRSVRLAAFTLAVLAAACATPRPRTAPRESAPARQVIVLSLDGAAASEFDRLQAQGAFSGGFARLLAQGEAAAYAVPVSPAATSVNHASLVSGYPPARTGIVSNAFHVAGRPLEERAAGLYLPSATETLWDAARRQGKRVGVVAYPGVGVAGPRGDWGMDWMRPLTRSEIVTVRAGDYRPIADGRATARPSFSPVLGARLEGASSPAFSGCEAFAVDGTDDGRTDYDELLLPCADPSGSTVPGVRVGQWIALRVEIPGAEGGADGDPVPPLAALAWCQLLALDPQTAAARLYIGPASPSVGYPAAYAATLERLGLRWPGAADDRLAGALWRGEPGIDLDGWFDQCARLTHFLVDAILAGLADGKTDLVLGYLPALDQAGHLLQLESPRQALYTPQRRAALGAMRERVWRLVDTEVGRLLGGLDLRRTAVLVVSDHGMQAIHTAVDLDAAFERAGLLAFSSPEHIDPARTQVWAVGYGGVAHVYFNLVGREPGGIVAPGDVPGLEARVRGVLEGLVAGAGATGGTGGERPVEAVFDRDAARTLDLDSPHSGDLVAFATPGYVFRGDWKQGSPILGPPSSYGDHAYANTVPTMRALFLAVGAGVAHRRTGPRSVLDVAPRAAQLLGIERPLATAPGGANP
jgi:predicted AlkP superfamily pyrophosphatase or phosphodiesterase